MKPSSASLLAIRSAITPTITSSGTKSPRSMYSFASLADLGAVAHGGAEDVAGGVVGQVEVLLQALALGPLAGAGRAEQDQIQLGHADESLETRAQSSVGDGEPA